MRAGGIGGVPDTERGRGAAAMSRRECQFLGSKKESGSFGAPRTAARAVSGAPIYAREQNGMPGSGGRKGGGGKGEGSEKGKVGVGGAASEEGWEICKRMARMLRQGERKKGGHHVCGHARNFQKGVAGK